MDSAENPGSDTPEMQPAIRNKDQNDTFRMNRAPKKHYSEYLVQGLFIFASVSLGFLSQNIRERISNRDKEEQYIASYLRNLRVDSVQLEDVITNNLHKVQVLDSIMMLSLKDLSNTDIRKQFLQNCFSIVSYYNVYSSNDATFIQLINSDGLRIIKRDHVADSISKYASELKGVYAAMELYALAISSATDVAHEVLDYSITYDSIYYSNKQLTGKFVPFLTNDPQKFKKFINKVYFERLATQNYVEKLQLLQPFLKGLMEYLREQYVPVAH